MTYDEKVQKLFRMIEAAGQMELDFPPIEGEDKVLYATKEQMLKKIRKLQGRVQLLLEVVEAAKAMRNARYDWDVPITTFDAALAKLEK